MATAAKPVKKVPPFQGVRPPEPEKPAPEPAKPAVNELEMSPEVQRRLEEEYQQDLLRDVSGEAELRSRQESMGTLKEPKKEPKPVEKKAKGGVVSSASKRADSCAQRGKTKGRLL